MSDQMTHPLAALIAGVPRWSMIEGTQRTFMARTTSGEYLHVSEVIAALETATPPDLVEAGKVVERLRAEKSVISTTRTFPSGDERDMVLVPHYGPNPLAHEAADTIRALIALATAQAAQIAGLDAERGNLSEKLELERALTDGAHRRAKAAEAKVAELETQIAKGKIHE